MRRLFYNDDEFSQAFQSLKDYREVPPVGNWRQINAKLDQRKAYRYTRFIGVAAVLTVIVGLGLSIYFSTEPARLRTQALRQENLTRKPLAVEPVITKPSAKPHVNNIDAAVVASQNVEQLAAAFDNVQTALSALDVRQHDVIKALRTIRRGPLTAPLKTLDYHAYEMLTGVDLSEPTALDKHEATSNYVCMPFYVGVNIQPQHTMLTSSNALNDPNLNNKFSPGLAYGVSAGYRLSEAWALETGGMLSMENNRYEATREQQAKKVAKLNAAPEATPALAQYRLALSYYRIPLMVKFRMPWNPKRRSICEESVSMIGGVQYGYFRNGFNERVNADADQAPDVVTEDIKRSDVQVLTGVERSSAVSRHLSVNYGFRVGYGLRQISSLETERLTKFNNPHNLSAAFNLALTFSK